MNHAPTPAARILLVEDQALVALEFEALLEELGCEVVGPFGEVDQALVAARVEILTGGVLDVTLGSEASFPVAFCLLERRVPFFFVTGLSSSALPPALQGVPCIAKPIRARTFAREVGRLLEARI